MIIEPGSERLEKLIADFWSRLDYPGTPPKVKIHSREEYVEETGNDKTVARYSPEKGEDGMTEPNTTETKRLIYKDDKKDKFHVYTPQELERMNEINLLRQKAVSLYGLALELLKRADTAAKNGNHAEADHWDIKARECKCRGLAIEEEALKKQLELLESIQRIEGWEQDGNST